MNHNRLWIVAVVILELLHGFLAQDNQICLPDPDSSKNRFQSSTLSWNQTITCREDVQHLCDLRYSAEFLVERTRSRCCRADNESPTRAVCRTTTNTNQFVTNFTTLLEFSRGANLNDSLMIGETASAIGNIDAKIWFRGPMSSLVLKGKNGQSKQSYDPFDSPQLKLMPQARLLLGSFDAPESEESQLTVDSSKGDGSCTSMIKVYHGSLLMFADGKAKVECDDSSQSIFKIGSDTGFSAWSTASKPSLEVLSKDSCTAHLSTKGRSQTFLTGSKILLSCSRDEVKHQNATLLLGGYWSFSSGEILVKDSKMDVGSRSRLPGFHESSLKLHDSKIMVFEKSKLDLDPRIGDIMKNSSMNIAGESHGFFEVDNLTVVNSNVKVQDGSMFIMKGSHLEMTNSSLSLTESALTFMEQMSSMSMSKDSTLKLTESTSAFQSLYIGESASIEGISSRMKVMGDFQMANNAKVKLDSSKFFVHKNTKTSLGEETKLEMSRDSVMIVGRQANLKFQDHTSLTLSGDSKIAVGEQSFLNISAVMELRANSKIIVEDRAELHVFSPVWCVISADSKIHVKSRGRLIITSAYFTPGSYQSIDITVPEGETKVWVTPYVPPKVYSVGKQDEIEQTEN